MTRKAERWIFAAVFTLANLLWFMAYGRVDAKLHKSKLEKAAYVSLTPYAGTTRPRSKDTRR